MTTWFDTARFGMFIHWAASSQRGWELSWPLVGGSNALPGAQSLSVEDTTRLRRRLLRQVRRPRDIARRAKAAGMQYGVLITNIMTATRCFIRRRDGLRSSTRHIRRISSGSSPTRFAPKGLKVGFYFSLIDWHHPDYPAFTDADKPVQLRHVAAPVADSGSASSTCCSRRSANCSTNYGKIDLLWFDGGWERTGRVADGGARNDDPRAPARHHHQRSPARMRRLRDTRAVLPAAPPSAPWETCMTMNDSWGYNPVGPQLKSPR